MDGPVEVGYPPISRKFAMPPTTTKGGEVMSEVFMAGSDRCYGGNKSLPYVRQSLLTFRSRRPKESPTPSPPPSFLGRQTTSPIASTHLPAHADASCEPKLAITIRNNINIMSLHDLPPELMDRVIFFLAQLEASSDYIKPSPHISQYANTSFNVQCAVEQHLFSRLSITSDDTPMFEKLITQSPRRRCLLRTFSFTPVLPAYDEQACARFERLSDKQANDGIFTTEISRFYAAIRDCNNLLSVMVQSPYSPTDRLVSKVNQWENNSLKDKRYAHSHLNLAHLSEAPLLDRVTTFSAVGDGPRYITPSSTIALLRCHPLVERLELVLDDNQRRYPELRAQLRTDFAHDLLTTQCSAVKRFELDYRCEDPADQRFSNADVRSVRGTSSTDAFSLSLRQFLVAAPKLEFVRLEGPICIDESLFEPPHRWHGLHTMYIGMSAVRPDGGWYLDEQPTIPRGEPSRQNYKALDDEDDESLMASDSESSAFSDDSFFAQDGLPPDDYDPHREALRTGDAYVFKFRFLPNSAFEKVLEAAARLAISNDLLGNMCLTMGVDGCPRTEYQAELLEFEYDSGNHTGSPTTATSSFPTLSIYAPREWKMSQTLAELWTTKLGEEGVITYLHRW
jgi:hypothetical protein